MNFGDILDKWDAETAKPYGKKRIQAEKHMKESNSTEVDSVLSDVAIIDGKRKLQEINPMELWMRRYGVSDKDHDAEVAAAAAEESSAEIRRRLLAMEPEASLDLHGLTRDEAYVKLDIFIHDCFRQGLRKVLIIHGKGNHSAEEPVLRRMVQLYFEQSELTGASGLNSKKNSGGTGSTWVILRKKES